MITLVLFVIHAALLWAAFASPRELAGFAVLDARLRWGLVLTGLMIPVLTGAVAWFLTPTPPMPDPYWRARRPDAAMA